VFGLHRLLWEMRADPALAARYAADPDAVLAGYDLEPAQREAFAGRDFKALYECGANPYLLYFCALQLGVDRAEYYAQLRSSQVTSNG
jgi:hypothetical protein